MIDLENKGLFLISLIAVKWKRKELRDNFNTHIIIYCWIYLFKINLLFYRIAFKQFRLYFSVTKLVSKLKLNLTVFLVDLSNFFQNQLIVKWKTKISFNIFLYVSKEKVLIFLDYLIKLVCCVLSFRSIYNTSLLFVSRLSFVYLLHVKF